MIVAQVQGGPDSTIMIDNLEGQSEGGGGPVVARGPGVWDPWSIENLKTDTFTPFLVWHKYPLLQLFTKHFLP